MCRILSCIVKPKNYPDLLKQLVKQFVKASSNDVYLRGRRHSDGWGYAGFGFLEQREIPVLMFYKTISPIDSSYSLEIIEALLSRASKFNTLYLILHSRLAGSIEPYGEIYAHPYVVEEKRFNLWFIHNGGVDKFKLAENLGLNPLLYTDSWLAALHLAKQISGCNEINDECVTSAYIELNKFVTKGSSLNTALMVLTERGASLYTTYMPSDEALYDVYYKLYVYSDNDNVAVFSSTVAYYLEENGGFKGKVKPLEKGIYKLTEVEKTVKLV